MLILVMVAPIHTKASSKQGHQRHMPVDHDLGRDESRALDERARHHLQQLVEHVLVSRLAPASRPSSHWPAMASKAISAMSLRMLTKRSIYLPP
jgi:hypothetical protein